MHEKVAIIIQARMGSSRLPGKSLLPFGNSTILGYLIDSLNKFGFSYKQIYVATSSSKENIPLIQHVKEKGCKYFAGSEEDVLSRYKKISEAIDYEVIVRLTADNPLISPLVISCCIDSHFQSGSKVSCTRFIDLDGKVTRFLPKGSSVDIFQKDTLLDINDDECNEFDREHVIPVFFRKNKVNLIKKTNLKQFGINLEDIVGLSIDTLSDYNKACKMVNNYE